jgi:hypothetical protein
VAVAQVPRRELSRQVRDEERSRQQPDRGQRDPVGLGERVGGGADARHVPGGREAERDPGHDEPAVLSTRVHRATLRSRAAHAAAVRLRRIGGGLRLGDLRAGVADVLDGPRHGLRKAVLRLRRVPAPPGITFVT